tara:strand:- start:610 stop:1383 length:774 start_codon:yes stop_codon:yes gene_type:complete
VSYILISNDDGIHGEGLTPLVEAVSQVSDVKVVVPLENCSGASNKLTLDRPLSPKTLKNGYIAVPGTPTDCVYLSCQGMFDEEPAFVVSGINEGANLGDDVLYSGTVAAALEGRFLSKSAIAISLVGKTHYQTAAYVARYLLEHWGEFSLPQPCVLNVNVPDLPLEEIAGFKVTRLGRRRRAGKIEPHLNPRGSYGYWIAHAGEGVADEGTDFHAVQNNFVSLTPISIDMTHEAYLGKMDVLNTNLNHGLTEINKPK